MKDPRNVKLVIDLECEGHPTTDQVQATMTMIDMEQEKEIQTSVPYSLAEIKPKAREVHNILKSYFVLEVYDCNEDRIDIIV